MRSTLRWLAPETCRTDCSARLPRSSSTSGPGEQLGHHPLQLLGVGDLDAAPAEQHLHAVAEVLHPRAEEHRPSLGRRLEDVLPAPRR